MDAHLYQSSGRRLYHDLFRSDRLEPIQSRTPTVHRLHALLIAAAVCAACGAPIEPAPAAAAATPAHDVALPADAIVVSSRVTGGATLASILRAQQVASDDVSALVEQAGALFDLRKVRANQPYRLERLGTGALRRFDYEIDGDRLLRVTKAPGAAPEAVVLPIAKTRTSARVSGHIERGAPSLVSAMEVAGETIELTLAVAEIFGGEIDFSTELQPGDRFDITVEKQFRDDAGGAFAGYGPIAAAEFVNAGRRLRAIRFTPAGGQPGYYDERGMSMKRFFLASPLKFNPVVTSAFSRSRLHPILKEYRAHLGVDYRAPAGSPVVAVADGFVVSAGNAGGAGRLVHLRHANGFESEYLHLSSIAVRAGAHVRQGELVGRVGSSGLATGAHLDYRLKKNGAFINPVTAHRSMPPGEPVPASQMVAFAQVRERAFSGVGTVAVARASNPNSAVR
jgi:murein DD-endopeptidase MepM/ murein hydrolase activator NlpD